MKILFFSHYFYPEGNAPASRVHALSKHWVRQGHEVTVVTCAPNVPNGKVYPPYKNRICKSEFIDGVKVVRVWTFLAANRGKRRRSLNFLTYLCSASLFGLFRKADVVVATSPQFFCGWAGIVVSKLRLKPFILEIRDIWPESIQAVSAELGSWPIRILQWLEMHMYKAATRIVTVGQGYSEVLAKKGVPQDKMSIVMNGLDTDIFSPKDRPSELAKQLGVADKFVCSYIGTIGMACGLNVVLDAAWKLERLNRNDIHFLLVGDGAYREGLESRARQLGLHNVTFTGQQPKNRMPDYLALSGTCLVHLRKSELFKSVMPSKIFEASGMKRSIIMGVDGHARKLVEQAGNAISIVPEDPDDLVRAVCYLADHPEETVAMAEKGYHYIRENFDRKALAQNYLDILEEVVREKKGDPVPVGQEST